ncbi:MAG: M48 family metalloprotease [Acidobacteria bacterium]|nr:M48 family metalloprotease [Acidobacteriota bacterium]
MAQLPNTPGSGGFMGVVRSFRSIVQLFFLFVGLFVGAVSAQAASQQSQRPPALPPAPAATGPASQAQVPQADASPDAATDVHASGSTSAAAEREPAKTAPVAPQFTSNGAFDQAVDRTIMREHEFVKSLQKYTPLVETYVQDLKYDADLAAAPSSDNYFLGRLQLTTEGAKDQSYLPQPGFFGSMLKRISSLYSLEFLPLGFAQMTLIDNTAFDRQHYQFRYFKREFLGDTRCIVMDVTPRNGSGAGRFLGRIWVEDQDFNVVRFNGTYVGSRHAHRFLHFDSWRLNLQPGVWLPAYIYTEESDFAYRLGTGHARFKALTRLWGYDLKRQNSPSEMTAMVVEPPGIHDQSDGGHNLSPVESQRSWQEQAEENAIDRLTHAGLLSQPGEVDKILETVVNNLEITNKLEIHPEVHCRIMLTTPFESFTIGHTIVLTRGLIDVLPDEASLAAVLAHELAHLALGHHFDTKWAFSDRMLFPDEQTFRKMNFHHRPEEEAEADAKALEYLKNSPYKDKLNDVGVFMRAVALRQHTLPHLIQAHLGNTLIVENGRLRYSPLESTAPQLKMRDVQQIPALPMGSRLYLDPWSDRVELVKSKPVPLLSPSEKLLFEVTPVFPYVSRYKPGSEPATKASNDR